MRPSPVGSGRFGEALGEVGEFAGEPGVDLLQLRVGVRVVVGIVRKRVVAFLDAEPAHLRLADGAHVLQRGHAGHVIGERVHQQIDLHAADLRGVVVHQFDARVELRHRVRELRVGVGAASVPAPDCARA